MAKATCSMKCKHRSKRPMQKYKHASGDPCYGKDESGDVGEDALVLAARKRKESSQEPQKTEEKAARKTEIDGQMSLF